MADVCSATVAARWQDLVADTLARRWTVLAPLTVALSAPLLLRHREVVAWPALIFLAAVCVLLGAVDLRHRRLPVGVVLGSYPVLAGLLLVPALAHHELSAWGRATAAAVVVGVAMHLIPNRIIGHGDAKLLGLLVMMPAWFGWSLVLPALLVFFVPVAVESVALLATGRAKRGDQIAFGPPLMVGAYLYLLLTAKGW
ncbi:prepilin peptidase [Catenulispora sp. NL8]|uniref:Prepilin peptidase n=1 Tax=Catenulispora pinistramenti TaxID=2705254 RepID=A0ABS5KNT5_9ACTN|nr:A24 family peptidase [Catenulispora pinistramenti]MBS2547710.1 prepilin peptidase [Catenulispora pinistramenti]